MRDIKQIILHCSDSPDERDIGLEEINAWHKERGFTPSPSNGFYCGYHWIIRRDGLIEMGRPESEPGIHCRGHNRASVGICLVGRVAFTSLQEASLFWLLRQTMGAYGLGPKDVYGHREFNGAKTCPNIDDLDGLREELEREEEDGS